MPTTLQRLTLAHLNLIEAWEAYAYQALPVSWWPVSMCIEAAGILS